MEATALETTTTSVKKGVWVLAALGSVAAAAAVVMVLTVPIGESPTNSSSPKPSSPRDDSNTTLEGCPWLDEIRCGNNTAEEAARKKVWDRIRNITMKILDPTTQIQDPRGLASQPLLPSALQTLKWFCNKQEAKKIFEGVGGWPMLTKTPKLPWTSGAIWEIEKLFQTLFLDDGGLIKISLGVDNDGNVLLKIGAPDLRWGKYFSKDLDYFINKMNVAKLFGAEEEFLNLMNLKQVITFENTVAELIQSSKENNNKKTGFYNSLKKDDSLRYIPWDLLYPLSEKFDKEKVKYEIEEKDYLYLEKLKGVMKKEYLFSTTNVANYLFWRLAERIAPYIRKDFQNNISGFGTDNPDHDYCLQTVIRHTLPIVLQRYLSEDLKSKIQEAKLIAENIRQAIIEQVHLIKTPSERKKIIDEIESIAVHIGYPNDLENISLYTEVDKFQSVTNSANFLQAHIELSKWNRYMLEDMIFQKKMYRELLNLDEISAPTASYSVERKYIAIKTGLLEPPFFDPSMSEGEKYGSLGYTIADLFHKVLGKSVCTASLCSETVDIAFRALLRSNQQENVTALNQPINTGLEATQSTSVTPEIKVSSTTVFPQLTPAPLSLPHFQENEFKNAVAKTLCKTLRESKIKEMLSKTIELRKSFLCDDNITANDTKMPSTESPSPSDTTTIAQSTMTTKTHKAETNQAEDDDDDDDNNDDDDDDNEDDDDDDNDDDDNDDDDDDNNDDDNNDDDDDDDDDHGPSKNSKEKL